MTGADTVADAVSAAKKADNAVDGAKTVSKGWKLGNDISSPTKAGNDPSWTTLRQRYWKNEFYYNSNNYTNPNDIAKMKKGRAPIGVDGYPIELHHPNGRQGKNFYYFTPMIRTEHRFYHYGK
ncbi:MAG: hypothetical protein IKA56_00410 [Clostridia bacterium]|nr:hypothetical protein [Clostridia bacterium]